MYSVVVPTFNRARVLAATLDSLLMQAVDFAYEIIVVDNNSSDDTVSLIQAFERRAPEMVRYVFENEQGSSAARNAGIAVARGACVAFLDDDEIAQPNWLKSLAATYRAHPDAWCVGGKVTLRLPGVLPSWFEPASRSTATYLGLLDYGEATIKLVPPGTLITGNLSVRRDALSRVGVFKTDLGRFAVGLLSGEDIELCLRIHEAGGGIYYCGEAVVTHMVPASRMTKRFFRERAYWQGRTEGLLSTEDDQASSWRKLGSEGVVMTKDWMKTLVYYGIGNSRQAFEHELAAWKRLGHLYQTSLSARKRGTDNVVSNGPAWRKAQHAPSEDPKGQEVDTQ